MQFNINDTCEVILTSYGVRILNEYYRTFPSVFDIQEFFSGDEYSCECWLLMNIFGPHIQHHLDTPFKNNVIKIVRPLA